jgi:hypothetical protein
MADYNPNDNLELQNLPKEQLEGMIDSAIQEGTPKDKVKKEESKAEGEIKPEEESQEPQPIIKETPPAPETTEPGEQEDWTSDLPEELKTLVDKKGFKSLEDVAKSYENLETRSTKAEQQRSRYRNILEPYAEFDEEDGSFLGWKEPQQQQQASTYQTQPQITQDQILDGLEQRYNALVMQHGEKRANILLQTEIAARIAQGLTQQATKPITELAAKTNWEEQKAELRKEDSEFAKWESKVDGIGGKMPLEGRNNPEAVRWIYYRLRGEDAIQQQRNKVQEDKSKTEAIQKMKVKAQVESSTKSPGEPQPDIEKMSAEEYKRHFGLRQAER